jgi:hypothetical protein
LLVGGFQVFGAADNAGGREAHAALGADYRIATQAGASFLTIESVGMDDKQRRAAASRLLPLRSHCDHAGAVDHVAPSGATQNPEQQLIGRAGTVFDDRSALSLLSGAVRTARFCNRVMGAVDALLAIVVLADDAEWPPEPVSIPR